MTSGCMSPLFVSADTAVPCSLQTWTNSHASPWIRKQNQPVFTGQTDTTTLTDSTSPCQTPLLQALLDSLSIKCPGERLVSSLPSPAITIRPPPITSAIGVTTQFHPPQMGGSLSHCISQAAPNDSDATRTLCDQCCLAFSHGF